MGWCNQEMADSRRRWVIIVTGSKSTQKGNSIIDERGAEMTHESAFFFSVWARATGDGSSRDSVASQARLLSPLSLSWTSITANQISERLPHRACKGGAGSGVARYIADRQRDWCKLTKLEPYWVSAPVLPAPQGPWGDLRHSFNPPIPLRCFFWLPPTCIHLNLSYIPSPSYLIMPSKVRGSNRRPQ